MSYATVQDFLELPEHVINDLALSVFSRGGTASAAAPEAQSLIQKALDWASAIMDTRLRKHDTLPLTEIDSALAPLCLTGACLILRQWQGRTFDPAMDLTYMMWVDGLKGLEDRLRVRYENNGGPAQQNMARCTITRAEDPDQGTLSTDYLVRRFR